MSRRSVTPGVATSLLTAGTLACMLPALLCAQVGPLGTEFQVNTYTPSSQSGPAVAAAGNGDFVVVWASSSQDGYGTGVFGQRYASSGSALGTEFQVNTYTPSNQFSPAVAAAGNGDFVVVWASRNQDGSFYGVFSQRYASSGSALGAEFQVNTYTPSRQYAPAVAAAGNGDFAVVWNSSQDGSSYGVFGHRYASSGSALGMEFQVNTYTPGIQSGGAVAIAGNGDFVVVWRSYPGQDGFGDGVFGQRYASSGSALGAEFQVNTYTPTSQFSPAVAAAGNGDFVVVWESRNQDGSSYGVFSQRYASSGSALGTEFQVNNYTPSVQGGPAVAASSNGDFVVLWESYLQDGSSYGVFNQRYGELAASPTATPTSTATPSGTPTPTPGVAGTCAVTPLGNCATPGKSLLLIKDKSPAGASLGDRLIWKWLKGPATTLADFDNPTTTTDYSLCIYAGTGQTLAIEASVPPVTNWRTLSTKGYEYKDPAASTDGIFQILLKGGDVGAAKILVKGKDAGFDLTPSTLPLDDTANVTVQIHNSENANCWEETFAPAAIRKNTAEKYKAKVP